MPGRSVSSQIGNRAVRQIQVWSGRFGSEAQPGGQLPRRIR